jgi:hypothetical protein
MVERRPVEAHPLVSFGRLGLGFVGCVAACLLTTSPASPKPAPSGRSGVSTWAWTEPLGPLSWLGDAVDRRARLRLWDGETENLLRHYARPARGSAASWKTFSEGRYGRKSWRRWPSLSWSPVGCNGADDPARTPLELRDLGFALSLPLTPEAPPHHEADLLPTWILGAAGPPEPAFIEAPLQGPCPAWREPKPVTVARYGAEVDSFRLLECDGSVAVEALDRLSILMRPPLVDRPELPLPAEPDPDATDGEWVAGVKLADPRLVWLVAQLGAAFPYRWVYLVSAYRRDAHGSYHRRGRALDLFVMGVSNETLFKYCRKLRDVGCGYYPNANYVHLDVRPFGSGHPMWIDVARPGETSRYVDTWPGLVESGALTGAGEE